MNFSLFLLCWKIGFSPIFFSDTGKNRFASVTSEKDGFWGNRAHISKNSKLFSAKNPFFGNKKDEGVNGFLRISKIYDRQPDLNEAPLAS